MGQFLVNITSLFEALFLFFQKKLFLTFTRMRYTNLKVMNMKNLKFNTNTFAKTNLNRLNLNKKIAVAYWGFHILKFLINIIYYKPGYHYIYILSNWLVLTHYTCGFLTFTQKIFRQPIPENSWLFPKFVIVEALIKKKIQKFSITPAQSTFGTPSTKIFHFYLLL